MPLPKPVIGDRRHDLEEQFVNAVLHRAGFVTNGHDLAPIKTAVKARLQKGAREYGDAQFWNADCVDELRQEGLDWLGWGSLEYVKQLAYGNKEKANVLIGIVAGIARQLIALDEYEKM